MGVYWVVAFLLYLWGPLSMPRLSDATYWYLGTSAICFVSGYFVGLRRFHGRQALNAVQDRCCNGFVPHVVQPFLVLAFLGGVGYNLDLILTGSGSITRTLAETAEVRESLRTSWLTTVSVIPDAFSLVGICFYFFLLARNWAMPRLTHWLAWGTLLMALLKAFLSVNRGQFFWVAMYVLFFVVVIHPRPLAELLRSRAYRWGAVLSICFLAGTVAYVLFIARHRTDDRTLRQLGNRSAHASDSEFFRGLTDVEAGTVAQIVQYATHEFVYTDAFVRRGDLFELRPTFLLGSRLLSQVKRVNPSYEIEAYRVGMDWLEREGLSTAGWPSVFGWNVVMFGLVGGVAFMLLLGWLFGSAVGHYVAVGHVGSLVVAFCMYGALNVSFNNIGGDFAHNFGYLFGIYLLASRRYNAASCRPRTVRHGFGQNG